MLLWGLGSTGVRQEQWTVDEKVRQAKACFMFLTVDDHFDLVTFEDEGIMCMVDSFKGNDSCIHRHHTRQFDDPPPLSRGKTSGAMSPPVCANATPSA